MLKIENFTISQIRDGLQNKEFSCRELVQDNLDRIEKLDIKLKAYLSVTDELALERADAVDSKISKNIELKPLEGIPYSA
ncbi:Asp-tRNA(Asn)/Glu-tRNA(Gln) amidotransferase GatCAB subunit A, partial [Patescibacteria group bacterium]|nr:Asp-tRNA(Asn)/Glu-tRNA(Gln) amidotransferase GatCAB subunit A [Patescibacteria group bacterium]